MGPPTPYHRGVLWRSGGCRRDSIAFNRLRGPLRVWIFWFSVAAGSPMEGVLSETLSETPSPLRTSQACCPCVCCPYKLLQNKKTDEVGGFPFRAVSLANCETQSRPKGAGKLVPRENCQKVSKYFWHFLTIFDVFCPARRMSKSVENIDDVFWRGPLPLAPFAVHWEKSGTKCPRQTSQCSREVLQLARSYNVCHLYIFVYEAHTENCGYVSQPDDCRRRRNDNNSLRQ